MSGEPVTPLFLDFSVDGMAKRDAALAYLYRLEDRNKVGKADTLMVLAVRHAASQPFTFHDSDENAE